MNWMTDYIVQNRVSSRRRDGFNYGWRVFHFIFWLFSRLMTSQVALTLGVFLPNLSRNESHYLDLYWLSYKGLDFLWTRKTRKIRAKQTVSLFLKSSSLSCFSSFCGLKHTPLLATSSSYVAFFSGAIIGWQTTDSRAVDKGPNDDWDEWAGRHAGQNRRQSCVCRLLLTLSLWRR